MRSTDLFQISHFDYTHLCACVISFLLGVVYIIDLLSIITCIMVNTQHPIFQLVQGGGHGAKDFTCMMSINPHNILASFFW